MHERGLERTCGPWSGSLVKRRYRARRRRHGCERAEGRRFGVGSTGRAGRRQRQSRGVLGHRGLEAGLEGLHAEHEPLAAGRALTQRLSGELLETVTIVRRRVGRGFGRGHAQQLSAQSEFRDPVTADQETAAPPC